MAKLSPHTSMPIQPPASFADIGDLGGRKQTPAQQQRREAFALLWKPLQAALKDRGWTEFGSGSIVELYVTGSARSNFSRIWLSPTSGGLRIRLDAPSKLILNRIIANEEKLTSASQSRIRVSQQQIKRQDGVEWVVDVRTSLRELLRDATSSAELAGTLRDFVIEVVDTAEVISSAPRPSNTR